MTQKTRFRNQIVAFKYSSVLVNIPRFHIHRGAQLVTVNGCPLDFFWGECKVEVRNASPWTVV